MLDSSAPVELTTAGHAGDAMLIQHHQQPPQQD